MNRFQSRGVGIVFAAAIAGLVVGVSFGSPAGEDLPTGPASTIHVSTDGAPPPYTRLLNGKTAGNWTAETSDGDRPDYMPAVGERGKEGYVKVEEAWPTEPEGASITVEQMRQIEAKRPPLDAEGKAWVSLYAEDGTTVIGRFLVSGPADDSR